MDLVVHQIQFLRVVLRLQVVLSNHVVLYLHVLQLVLEDLVLLALLVVLVNLLVLAFPFLLLGRLVQQHQSYLVIQVGLLLRELLEVR